MADFVLEVEMKNFLLTLTKVELYAKQENDVM